MKYSSETLQYLPHFWNTKIKVYFLAFGNSYSTFLNYYELTAYLPRFKKELLY